LRASGFNLQNGRAPSIPQVWQVHEASCPAARQPSRGFFLGAPVRDAHGRGVAAMTSSVVVLLLMGCAVVAVLAYGSWRALR
jgi:hypothetical protein